MNRVLKIIIAGLFLFKLPAAALHASAREIIAEVSFEGNSYYSDSNLQRSIISRKSGFFVKRHYHPDTVREDIRRIRILYESEGYLNTEISYETDPGERENTLYIRFSIYEGEPYHISEYLFLGNEFYSEEDLEAKISFSVGDRARRRELNRSTAEIISLYTDNGFSDAEVRTDLRINHDMLSVSVDFLIRERDRNRIEKIYISGHEKTRENVITREIEFTEEEYIDFSALLRTRSNLYATSLFRSVNLRPRPTADNESGRRDVSIELRELMSVELGLSAGYDTLEKFWQEAEFTNRNLRGSGRILRLTGRRSSDLIRTRASLTEPRTFGTYWRSRLSVSDELKREPSYTARNTSAGIDTHREVEALSLRFSYDIIFSRLEDEQEGDYIGEAQRVKNIFKIGAGYDTRDSLILPRKGIYADILNEIILSDISFLRSSLSLRGFTPITSNLIAGSAVRVSSIFSKYNLEDIPPDERLYTGGPYSIRGFKYNSMGPNDSSGKPIGGSASVVINILELRKRVFGGFSLALFSDAGNIWESVEDFAIGSLRYSAGTGLRLELPIGVFRLDYSFNLAPEADESAYDIFFGAGMSF